MRNVLYVFLALVAVAGVTTGQSAGGALEVFIGIGNWGAAAPLMSGVGDWDNMNNSVPTTYITGSTQFGAQNWGNEWTSVTDTDNQMKIIYSISPFVASPSAYNILQWDPVSDSIVNTIWTGPLTGTPRNITNMAVDSNGDLNGFDSALNGIAELQRFPTQSATWSLTPVTVGGVNGGLGGFELDFKTGGFNHAISRNGASVGPQGLYHTSYDLSTTNTVAFNASTNVAAMGGTMLENGEWISSSSTGPSYIVVTPGNFAPGPFQNTPFWDVTREKWAAPGRGYYAGSFPTVATQTVRYMDATTTPHTVVKMTGTWPAAAAGPILETAPCYEHEISTTRSGNATWNINLQLDPTGATSYNGKQYVIAASLAGATPGISLASGRTLFINLDPIAIAIVQTGSFAPFFTNMVGVLNPFNAADQRARQDRLDCGGRHQEPHQRHGRHPVWCGRRRQRAREFRLDLRSPPVRDRHSVRR